METAGANRSASAMGRSGHLSVLLIACGALAAGCGATRTSGGTGAMPMARGGVTELKDGTWRVTGIGRLDPQEALNDSMARASAYARERAQRMTPLRIKPGQGSDNLGKPVYTCALTFRLEPEPQSASDLAGDHSASANEHRMRLLVEDGVLTIEEYARLIAAYPSAGAAPEAPPLR